MLRASADLTNIGLASPASNPVREILANIYFSSASPTFPGTGESIQPNDYFSGNTGGAYALSSSPDASIVTVTAVGGDYLTFTTTSFTITAGAIPEPSTYAALLGLGALGFATLVRHRSKSGGGWRRKKQTEAISANESSVANRS